MRARVIAIVLWVLVATGGVVGANLATSVNMAPAGGATRSTEVRTLHFRGLIGPSVHHKLFRFRVPSAARLSVRVVWDNPQSSVRAALFRTGRKIRADAKVGRTRVRRLLYAGLDLARYGLHVGTGNRVRTGFTATVTVRWRKKSSPSPSLAVSPSPSDSASPTVSPSPSDSPSPTVSPSPSPSGYPIKIFSVGTPSTKIGDALADPYVAGISVRFVWSNIEPSPGVFNWGPIDTAISQARAAHKLLMVRVMAGIYTPDWVDQQVPTLTFSNTYLYNPSNYPSTVTMPIPWNSKFQSLWTGFVGALGARYDGNPTIYSVQMPGCGFTGEMTLPADVQTWLNNGYTDANDVGCWESVIAAYRAAFATTPTNLDIVEPFPQSLLSTNVVSPTVTYATNAGAQNAYIQNNGLRAGMLGSIGPYRRAIRDAASVTKVGYQMIGDAATTSALHDAFTVAIQDQASYVEVYASDVLDATQQPNLLYLASDGTQ